MSAYKQEIGRMFNIYPVTRNSESKVPEVSPMTNHHLITKKKSLSLYDQLLDEIANCRKQIEKDIVEKQSRHEQQQQELEKLRFESKRLEDEMRQLQCTTNSSLEGCFLRVQTEFREQILKIDQKLEEVINKERKGGLIIVDEQHF
jgi:septal ring factor EnvC (AmiA/AmiB activator)